MLKGLPLKAHNGLLWKELGRASNMAKSRKQGLIVDGQRIVDITGAETDH